MCPISGDSISHVTKIHATCTFSQQHATTQLLEPGVTIDGTQTAIKASAFRLSLVSSAAH